MAAWVVCALCALVILKPQEFVPALSGLPLLYLLFGAAILFGVLDAAMGRLRLALAPHVPFVVGFLVWAALITLIRRPSAIAKEGLELAVVVALFGALSFFAGTSSGLKLFSFMFLGCALFVTSVAFIQSRAPMQCMVAAADDWEGKGELEPDGRECEIASDCRENAPDPDANYRCERPGPAGTSSIGGRVRYRGSLADPNELSLTIGMAIPLALAMAERRRKSTNRTADGKDVPGGPKRRAVEPLGIGGIAGWLVALAVILLIAYVIIESRSRTGVIVFLTVAGIAFVRRSGAWGIVLVLAASPVMLMLGGRSGGEADASSEERAELLLDGLHMIRHSLGIGVGAGQFGDESSIGMTAHNSYLLAAAEAGLIGLCLFGLTLYFAIKVPITIWLGDYKVDSTVARLAPALSIGLAGAYLGIFFLSWSYKDVLYMMLGASAALYQAARAQDPGVHVGVSLREAVLVCLASLAVLPLIYALLLVRS